MKFSRKNTQTWGERILICIGGLFCLESLRLRLFRWTVGLKSFALHTDLGFHLHFCLLVSGILMFALHSLLSSRNRRTRTGTRTLDVCSTACLNWHFVMG
jgi:hypothetical protein